MSPNTNNEETDRGVLKAKRDLLFKRFEKNPSHIQLAVEIKLIDDRIAEHTREMKQALNS